MGEPLGAMWCICASIEWVSVGKSIGLLPNKHQAFTRTIAELTIIHSGTDYSEIWNQNTKILLKKMFAILLRSQ